MRAPRRPANSHNRLLDSLINCYAGMGLAVERLLLCCGDGVWNPVGCGAGLDPCGLDLQPPMVHVWQHPFPDRPDQMAHPMGKVV